MGTEAGKDIPGIKKAPLSGGGSLPVMLRDALLEGRLDDITLWRFFLYGESPQGHECGPGQVGGVFSFFCHNDNSFF